LVYRIKQIYTLTVLCGIAHVIEAASSTHNGAFADCGERITLCCRVLLGMYYCVVCVMIHTLLVL
jgi:hypothetical protein